MASLASAVDRGGIRYTMAGARRPNENGPQRDPKSPPGRRPGRAKNSGMLKRVTGPRNKQLTHLETVGCDCCHSRERYGADMRLPDLRPLVLSLPRRSKMPFIDSSHTKKGRAAEVGLTAALAPVR